MDKTRIHRRGSARAACLGPAGQIRDPGDQAADHPARPLAGLFARRGGALSRISDDEAKAYDYTAKGNIVAIISNGTAVLGLGDLGAQAAKPVMEGKAVLFKRFADVDGIDLEVDTRDVDEFVNCVRFLGKSWGGINLEDIKAPECFIIEAAAARADGHPGVPRRPARHRDHHRRRLHQRAGT